MDRRESSVYPCTLIICFLIVLFRCNYCKGGGGWSYNYFHVNVAQDEFEKKADIMLFKSIIAVSKNWQSFILWKYIWVCNVREKMKGVLYKIIFKHQHTLICSLQWIATIRGFDKWNLRVFRHCVDISSRGGHARVRLHNPVTKSNLKEKISTEMIYVFVL